MYIQHYMGEKIIIHRYICVCVEIFKDGASVSSSTSIFSRFIMFSLWVVARQAIYKHVFSVKRKN